MAALLQDMPLDIVEHIANHLSLPDLRGLRLTCTTLATIIISTARFKGFCTRKTVELRVSRLEELTAWLSAKSGVQHLLQHLTVTGVLIVTHGLERIVREGTKPANRYDPCALRRNEYGNPRNERRVHATLADVEEAGLQLCRFRDSVEQNRQEREAGRDLEALSDLFAVIRTRCKGNGLKSLTLDVVVYREDGIALSPAVGAPWRRVWETASRVFEVSLRAWQRSGVKIERLDVYGSTETCALQASDIAALQERIDFGRLEGLKALSLCISNRLLPLEDEIAQLRAADKDEADHDDRWDRLRRQSHLEPVDQHVLSARRDERERLLSDPRNVTGVAEWMDLTPSLEEIHIHNFEVFNSSDRTNSNPSDITLIRIASRCASLYNLHTLSIHHARLNATTLLTLLRKAPNLTTLSLYYITLLTQTWEPLFAHLTSPASKFHTLHLDSLFELSDPTRNDRNYIIPFQPRHSSDDDSSTGETAAARLQTLGLPPYWDFTVPSADGINAFSLRRRVDVLKGIACRRNPSYVAGSRQFSAWVEQRRRFYGPN